MIINYEQYKAFSELSPHEKIEHFSIKDRCVKSHVDTLYYSVSVCSDNGEEPPEGILGLLTDLEALKQNKLVSYEAYVEFFGLSVENIRFANYEYCLRLNETFDIFIARYLPNDVTPRIVVQLRTRSLVLNGTCQAVCKSFKYVEDILSAYGLEVSEVKENRIDYAYHTNLIQNPYKHFCDDYLLNHLKTRYRKFTKVGTISSEINIDYLSFGSRRSNDVFVRIYNKSREVIEKNYKSFFFDKWLSDGLISAYDYFVYTEAFKIGCYTTGLLVGRINWYLKYGHNEDLKKELSNVKQIAYVDSDNVDQLKRIVDKYLPPVTLIINVEFQTKRKFYLSTEEFIKSHGIFQKTRDGQYEFIDESKVPLLRLWTIILLRSQYCDYLTTKSLRFVKDKRASEEELAAWWQRIHECYIEEYDKRVLDLWRDHDRNVSYEKSIRRFCSSVAQHSIIKSGDVSEKNICDFKSDISDLLSSLNDNDFYGFAANPETGKVPELKPKEYQTIKTRKKRQYKGIFDNLNNKNLKEKESE